MTSSDHGRETLILQCAAIPWPYPDCGCPKLQTDARSTPEPHPYCTFIHDNRLLHGPKEGYHTS